MTKVENPCAEGILSRSFLMQSRKRFLFSKFQFCLFSWRPYISQQGSGALGTAWKCAGSVFSASTGR